MVSLQKTIILTFLKKIVGIGAIKEVLEALRYTP